MSFLWYWKFLSCHLLLRFVSRRARGRLEKEEVCLPDSCMHCSTQWPAVCGTPWDSQPVGSFSSSTPKCSFPGSSILWHLPMGTFLSSTGMLNSPTRWLYSDFWWPGTLVNFSDIHGRVLTTGLYLSPVESGHFTDLFLSYCSASAFEIVAAPYICDLFNP